MRMEYCHKYIEHRFYHYSIEYGVVAVQPHWLVGWLVFHNSYTKFHHALASSTARVFVRIYRYVMCLLTIFLMMVMMVLVMMVVVLKHGVPVGGVCGNTIRVGDGGSGGGVGGIIAIGVAIFK